MSNKISFGKYKGRSFEWLFFNAPWYVDYIIENGIHRQRHNFDEDEEDYFSELYCRACSITTVCRKCNTRPVTRLGLTWHQTGALGHADFYCEDCEYMGGSVTSYHPASFFIGAHKLENSEARMITSEIKRVWIGDGNLTQKKMEEFFHNDAFFPDATPGFFRQPLEQCMIE